MPNFIIGKFIVAQSELPNTFSHLFIQKIDFAEIIFIFANVLLGWIGHMGDGGGLTSELTKQIQGFHGLMK